MRWITDVSGVEDLEKRGSTCSRPKYARLFSFVGKVSLQLY